MQKWLIIDAQGKKHIVQGTQHPVRKDYKSVSKLPHSIDGKEVLEGHEEAFTILKSGELKVNEKKFKGLKSRKDKRVKVKENKLEKRKQLIKDLKKYPAGELVLELLGIKGE